MSNFKIYIKRALLWNYLIKIFCDWNFLRNWENFQLCPCEVLHAFDNLGVCGSMHMQSHTSYYKDCRQNNCVRKSFSIYFLFLFLGQPSTSKLHIQFWHLKLSSEQKLTLPFFELPHFRKILPYLWIQTNKSMANYVYTVLHKFLSTSLQLVHFISSTSFCPDKWSNICADREVPCEHKPYPHKNLYG